MDLVKRTVELTLKNVENCRHPSVCTTARNGEIVAERLNHLVAQTHDPTVGDPCDHALMASVVRPRWT
ncbi:MAG TPA: hypothetical protein VFE09_03225 [Rubrobacteraceae bacterium]|nr:hypothetical protein [Rubrobacteraceae bacterium]